MATFNSQTAGNWSNTGTWGAGSVPGDGDTAFISHAITVDTNTIIGTSPSGNSVVVGVSGTAGRITVNSGISLTLRGDMNLENAELFLDPGSTFEFDASQSALTSSNYFVLVGDTHNENDNVVYSNGTSDSRVTVVSNTGGGNGYFKGGQIRGGNIVGYYTDYIRIGNASNKLADPWLNSTASTYPNCVLENCTFLSCGQIGGGFNPIGAAGISIKNCNFQSGVGSYDIHWGGTSLGTGLREVINNVFGVGPWLANYNSWTVSGNINGPKYVGNVNSVNDIVDNFMFMDGTQVDTDIFMSTYTNNYFVNTVSSNPHGITILNNNNATGLQTISGNIFDFVNDGGAGDQMLLSTSAFNATGTIVNNIFVPTSGAGSQGTLISCLGNAQKWFICEHNTSFAEIVVGETFNTTSGTILSIKSNIFVSPSGNDYIITNLNGSPVTDVVNGDDCTYNGKFNIAAGSEGGGYNTPMTLTPGTNDISGDPNFVDNTRNISTWDASLGGPGTPENAIAELQKLHLSTHNPDYTKENLFNWVASGYTPQNASFLAEAHDGQPFGANLSSGASEETPKVAWATNTWASNSLAPNSWVNFSTFEEGSGITAPTMSLRSFVILDPLEPIILI